MYYLLTKTFIQIISFLFLRLLGGLQKYSPHGQAAPGGMYGDIKCIRLWNVFFWVITQCSLVRG